jgi:hypothetical protein
MKFTSKRIAIIAIAISCLILGEATASAQRRRAARPQAPRTQSAETATSAALPDPNWGYYGDLGAAQVTKSTMPDVPIGLLAIHRYPNTSDGYLAKTKLRFEKDGRVFGVDGWIFLTDFDGTEFPSKVFFSYLKVSVNGVYAYRMWPYRTATGWQQNSGKFERQPLLR